jgi:Tol biopolymer transport system component
MDVQLWLMAFPGGEVRRISNDLADYRSVSVSGDRKTIVAAQVVTPTNLWLGPASAPDSARQITSGTLDGQRGLCFTPENRIVYAADRSQNWDLFIADADGGNVRQLMFDGHFHNSPTVSENGQSVVYESDRGGVTHLWKLDLKNGSSAQLTSGLGERGPQCGHGSDWVYDGAKVPDGQARIFRMPVSWGTGGATLGVFREAK